ncbi:MAG: SIS domain-containing protein [Candidatus Dadabacteria bacterium]|nr:MAG: SIS domain-containing protein [Candidatus Dadabacteria bacterium]
MDKAGLIRERFQEAISAFNGALESCTPDIAEASAAIVESFKGGGKLLICGNGGSAADAQHMAAEFVSRLTKEFERPALPAIALTTDTSFLTAYANDCGYEGVFARQIEGLGRKGDVCLGISTSGSSKNVIRAFETARSLGLKTISLTGQGDGLKLLSDIWISVPSTNTQHIQEAHLCIEHIICEMVEREIFGG